MPAKILRKNLLQLLRVRVIEMKKVTDDHRSRRQISRIGNDRHRGRSRVLVHPDDLDNVASRWDEGKAVQGQIHLDDVDGFFARDRLGNKDVHLALDVVVQDQFFAGQIFVEMQDVEHITVRVLHRHHVHRAVGRAGSRWLAHGAGRDEGCRPTHLGGDRHGQKERRKEAEKEAAKHALM